MSLEEKKQSVIDDFSAYDEWLDKYEYLIELGKSLEPYPEEKKTDDKLIKGCQSRVWLDAEVRDGRLWFVADSDAIITKGIISMLIDVYNGEKAEDIEKDDFSFVEAIGLKDNLSPTRANGLVAMIAKIKEISRLRLTPSLEMTKEEVAPEKKNNDVLTAEDVKELQPLYDNVVLALKQVYDPEIPVNIYDLGLIYELNINKKREVNILMTFTAPNCPMVDEVMAEVKESVSSVPGVKGCKIDLTFEPVWDRSMLSDEARLELGLDYDPEEDEANES